ncbi:MAG: protealysin inhibitor emfourin [Planctomycetaceae bacterium]
MAQLQVERIGGLAGFGGIGAHLRSLGQVDWSAISAAEQRAVEALFQSRGKARTSKVCDGFRYRITRTTSAGTETIEVPEESVPAVLAQCVKDEII